MGCSYSREIREGADPDKDREQCCDELPPPKLASPSPRINGKTADGLALSRQLAHEREREHSTNSQSRGSRDQSREASHHDPDKENASDDVAALLVHASHHRTSTLTLASQPAAASMGDGIVPHTFGFPEENGAKPTTPN